MQMSYTNRHSACSPPSPLYSAEEFPPLGSSLDPKKLDQVLRKTFKRFVTVKHQDENIKMSSLNPFDLDRKFKTLLGKKHTCKISKLRSGLLLIEVDRKPIYDKLIRTRSLDHIPVVIKDHDHLNTSKGTIYCDWLDTMTKDEIMRELADYDVKEVYRIERKEGNTTKKTHLYIITFNSPTLPKEVKIGFVKCDVTLHISNPRRCHNCQRYGHGKNTCRQETVCAQCGESGHEKDECDQEIKCYHCEQEHETSSRVCPMFKLEKLILEDKTKNDISFRQARERVYSANPKLVSSIPRLQRLQPQPKPTYKTVSAQSSAQSSEIASLHQTIKAQQQQITELTRQISELLAVLRPQRSITSFPKKSSSDPDLSFNLSSLNNYKRSLHDVSSSEEDIRPSNKRVPSNRQGGSNLPVTSSHESLTGSNGVRGESPQRQQMETPSRETSPSRGAEGGAMDLSVQTPSNVPRAPPDRRVKEGAKDGSSDLSNDQGSDVSRLKKGYRPGPKSSKFENVKSKIDSGKK